MFNNLKKIILWVYGLLVKLFMTDIHSILAAFTYLLGSVADARSNALWIDRIFNNLYGV